jgi:hypothetical protein
VIEVLWRCLPGAGSLLSGGAVLVALPLRRMVGYEVRTCLGLAWESRWRAGLVGFRSAPFVLCLVMAYAPFSGDCRATLA